MNYTDDTKLHTSDPSPEVVENDINMDLANTLHWFQQNGMKANPEKYQALVLGNTNHHISIKCTYRLIPISDNIKLLGVTIDNRFKFDANIADICPKEGGQVNALNRLKNILPCKTKQELYRAFICLLHFIAAKSGTTVGPETLANWRKKTSGTKIYLQGQLYILSYFVKVDRLTW